jgi:hypothetical protein
VSGGFDVHGATDALAHGDGLSVTGADRSVAVVDNTFECAAIP